MSTERLTLGRVGMATSVSGDPADLADAAEVESLGYSAIWIRGGQLDALGRISDVVHATKTVPVIPGIIPVGVFTPAAVSSFYADLEATDPGRFIVGIGGPQTARPLQGLNDFLDVLDDAEPPVPVERRLLAALGPRKLELARQRAAGAITLLVTPAYTAQARSALGAGATLVVQQMVVLDHDAGRARAMARGPLGFLSGIGGYRNNFLRMGFEQEDIAGLSDRLVDSLVVWGEPDVIASRVREQLDAGADHVALAILGDDHQPSPIVAARELAELVVT